MSKPGKAVLSDELRDVILVPLASRVDKRMAVLTVQYHGDGDHATAVMLTLHECAELAVSLLEAYAYNKVGEDAVPHVRKLLFPLLERN